MPDPIEELQNFNQQGLHVNPLSASEVRRRGDRMRRRNTALATVGAVAAAVIVIATPLAVVANRDTDSGPSVVHPAPPTKDQVAWLQKIPAAFELTVLPPDATFTFTKYDSAAVDDFTLCGAPAFSTSSNDPAGPAVDTAGASYGVPNSDGMTGRTLALYRDDTEAGAALEGLRLGVENCPEDPNGSGATLVNRIEDSQLPADDAFVYSQQAHDPDGLVYDLTVIQVARVGNALYLASESTTAGGENVLAFEVRRLAKLSAPVLSDMCVFAAEPC